MIRINLLPHREEKRKAKRQQFFTLFGLVAVLAGLIVFVVSTIIDGYISTQEGTNQFLRAEIQKLDKDIDQIKGLKEQTQALLARKKVIEDLQRDRAETVTLLSEMVRGVPEGVVLTKLKQDGVRVSLSGYAQSNARISTLMRNLEASSIFRSPVLIEIKSADLNRRRVSEFSMTVSLVRAPADAESGKK